MAKRGNTASKNQNPRKGIESQALHYLSTYGAEPSKNQNPRKGIESDIDVADAGGGAQRLQKTKIPARGLKVVDAVAALTGLRLFKKPKSPQGD